MTKPQLFHCLRFTDADRGIAFLEALGFEERLIVRNETDPSIVEHAQFQWRDNGGIMFGSVRPDEMNETYRGAVCNLVVDGDDEVDATVERALAAGGRMVGDFRNPPHGGRSALVADPDGNHWHLDSYQGA